MNMQPAPSPNYPKELFRNNHYRVTFGPEEDRKLQSEGWSEQKTSGQEYVVYHSGIPEAVPGSAEESPDAEAPEAEAPRRGRPGRPRKEASEPE